VRTQRARAAPVPDEQSGEWSALPRSQGPTWALAAPGLASGRPEAVARVGQLEWPRSVRRTVHPGRSTGRRRHTCSPGCRSLPCRFPLPTLARPRRQWGRGDGRGPRCGARAAVPAVPCPRSRLLAGGGAGGPRRAYAFRRLVRVCFFPPAPGRSSYSCV
jgi:hypothetical protein